MIIETTKLYIGKELYFREANMKDRTTYIDANLLVSPSSGMTDEQVRVFQRKLYIRAKQDKVKEGKRTSSYANGHTVLL